VTMANDGAGGVVLRWVDLTGQIYESWPQAGRFDDSGDRPSGWSSNGFIPPVAAPQDIDVASDGAGGALFVTDEARLDGEIWAYHVLADGTLDPDWPSTGLSVCAASGDQQAPRAVTDEAGGAFVGWLDLRDGSATAYLTRVTSNGTIAPGWPIDGKPLGPWPPAGSGTPELHSDGAGGVIVGLVGSDVRVLRYLGDGSVAPGWPESGVLVTTSATAPARPRLTVAPGAGTFVAWTEGDGTQLFRPAAARVLRLTPEGALDSRWPAGGRAFIPGTESYTDPALAPGPEGGVYLTWGVLSAGGERSLRGARIAEAGTVATGWSPTGSALLGAGASLASSSEFEDPAFFAVGTDHTGGLYVAWDDDAIPGTTQVRVSRWLSDGSRHPQWIGAGRLVPSPSGDGRIRSILGDADGGAYVAWREILTMPFGSAMLSWIGADGAADVPPTPLPSELALASDGGNPARGALAFLCTLDAGSMARLELFDVTGRRLRARDLRGGAGPQRVVLAGPGELEPGVLFARLTQGRNERWLRVVLVR